VVAFASSLDGTCLGGHFPGSSNDAGVGIGAGKRVNANEREEKNYTGTSKIDLPFL
jgi:hypothetical protein